MCNINVLIKRRGKAGLFSPFSYATANSYASNNHAEGVYFNSGKIAKSLNKLNLLKFYDDFTRSDFVLAHERISTSGFGFENTQPFASNRFVFAHNGVLCIKTDLTCKEKSDSRIFFESFVRNHAKSKSIRQALEDTFTEVCNSYGSYSIFIYDKTLNRGYYFKSSYTRISVVRLKGGEIYITTEPSNMNFFPVIQHYEIEPNGLYRIKFKGNKIKLKKIAKIDVKSGYQATLNNHPAVLSTTQTGTIEGWKNGAYFGDERDDENKYGKFYDNESMYV